ncbi:hypothetical protein RP20_CCG018933 [Aedes albopictus]|nr:hypothetical protein RP20_CCG018933 [Aedes albopictus]
MLIDSKVPKSLWGEAVLTGVYIMNRSPTAALPRNLTPAESWYKEKPSLEKLRIFGCQAFAWIPGQCRKKLDPKSQELLMVGYAPNGYRLWNKSTRRIVIARDVKFNEKYFPYAEDCEESGLEQLIVPMTYEQEGEEVQADVQAVQPDVQTEAYELTDDEDLGEVEEDSALPSHSDRDVSSGRFGEPSPRRSERERKLPG